VDCKPAERVSVIVFHGTADHLVPFRGGTTPFQASSRRSDNSVAGAISFWVNKDNCSATPRHKETSEVHMDFYSGCQDDTAVALYAIQGGRHIWPGLVISSTMCMPAKSCGTSLPLTPSRRLRLFGIRFRLLPGDLR
jgi:poly(3-hydroxybutyrate) depolymerase